MFENIVNLYNDVLSRGDPRSQHLPMIYSPKYIFFACFTYLITIKVLLPSFMKNRKPFVMKKIIFIYNLLQIFISAYTFYECLAVGWFSKYSLLSCNEIDYSMSENALREIRVTYIYFLTKFFEFADTIFFILRKKDNQVAFIHVYHHIVMPWYSWSVTKYIPGGSGTFISVMNSLVHVVMYSYYLLSGLGPKVQKYLWWKKYITLLQIVQFFCGFLQCLIVVYSTNCNILKYPFFFYIPQAAMFFFQFSFFYKQSYKSKLKNN